MVHLVPVASGRGLAHPSASHSSTASSCARLRGRSLCSLTTPAGPSPCAVRPAQRQAKAQANEPQKDAGAARAAGQETAKLPPAVASHVLRSAAALAAAGAAYSSFLPSAGAFEEREWLPRRHHRRLGETERQISAVKKLKAEAEVTGVNQSSSSTTASKEKTIVVRSTGQAREFTMSMKAAPTKTKADTAVMSTIPAFAWLAGAVAIAAGVVLWKFPKLWSQMTGTRTGGRWVRDRTLGGKMVWIPDSPSGASRSSSQASSSPLTEISGSDVAALTSEAAKWRATVTPTKISASKEEDMPSWWDLPPRLYVTDERKAELTKEMKRVLKQLEDSKLGGMDYPVWDLVSLCNKFAEGNVGVKPHTVSGRDAMLRSGVEAALQAAIQGSTINIGGLSPARFVSGLAEAILVPDAKAKQIANGAVAAKARALLLSVCAGFRAGNEADIIIPLANLGSIVTNFPPERGAAETEMMSSSIMSAATLEERKGVLQLFFSINSETAPQVAEMLGFDPELVIPLLEGERSGSPQPAAPQE